MNESLSNEATPSTYEGFVATAPLPTIIVAQCTDDPLPGSGFPAQLRLNGGYWSVTSRIAYASTRRPHLKTPTT